MRSLESELAYFRIRLAQAHGQSLNEGAALPPGAIRTEVKNGPFRFSEEELEEVIRQLEANFTTQSPRGSSIKSDYRPWLAERREQIDFYYWDRLRRYYLEGNRLPPQVVATLDAVTDEVLDFLGDPTTSGAWSRRGMVMGHVQSGKTTNYSALICKAADAGYRAIILLAGLTNSLRSQTQERLDETFIGKKSVFHATAAEGLPIQTYALKRRFPAYGTSRDSDFTRANAGIFFSLTAHNEPIIFVTKKNKKILEVLRNWLVEQGHGNLISAPLLLIDDEADNASINTSSDPSATTSINKVIRELLSLFERSSYVGYTATPFANIFIDPDSEQEMLGNDLFPKHFIKELDPPSNYVGAARVFAEDGDLQSRMIVKVSDFGPMLPLSHKSSHQFAELPSSLYTALRVFVLSRALRMLRGQANQHCSMMINVSRFNSVQEKVMGLVYAYLERVRNSLTVNAGLGPAASNDPLVAEMKLDFEREYASCGYTFEKTVEAAAIGVRAIKPVLVNMRGGKLDYTKHSGSGLHVIAIGGLALSRGLTIEGLTVSYILRNTAAADTLMQMARWFGYRPGYEDLCRLYLPKESVDYYVDVHEAIEELRAEVRRMQVIGLTPQDFGLRVRESPLAIRITAANKMRTASELTVAQDYSGRHIEGHTLYNDDKKNKENVEAASIMIREIGARPKPAERFVAWDAVPGRKIFELLKRFQFPPAHPDLGIISGETSLFLDYVGDRLATELREWDVAIPHLAHGTPVSVLPELSFPIRSRDTGTFGGDFYKVTGSKNRVADPDDAKLMLGEVERKAALKDQEAGLFRGERAFCAQRTRPLLIVHLFSCGKKDDARRISDPIVSLSACLPLSNVPPKKRTYQVNLVYKKQLEMLLEDEDDQAILETGDA